MATPRTKLVSSTVPLYYHITSRCVQQAWLIGPHPTTGADYSHRKKWVIDRFKHLAKYFALEICAYAIMSNHFHLVVYFDPLQAMRWTDEEVAERWINAFPPRVDGKIDQGMQEILSDDLLANPIELKKTRAKLGDLSCFMKHLKQNVAIRANKEVGSSGNFWSSRFYSGALLDEAAVLAAMAYVDLNPYRAGIANNIQECVDTSVYEMMEHARNDPQRLTEYLQPIVSGLRGAAQKGSSDYSPKQIRLILAAYLNRLNYIIGNSEFQAHEFYTDTAGQWISHMTSICKRQRAYGSKNRISDWIHSRGFRALEKALV